MEYAASMTMEDFIHMQKFIASRSGKRRGGGSGGGGGGGSGGGGKAKHRSRL